MARKLAKSQCELRQKDKLVKQILQIHLVVFLDFSLISPQVYQPEKEIPHKIKIWIQPQMNHLEDRLTSSISLNLHLDTMTKTTNASFHTFKQMNL